MLRKVVLVYVLCAALGAATGCKFKPPVDNSVEMARGIVARGTEPFVGSFLMLLIEKQNRTFSCSGVLLGPRHVLTAGHCVEGAEKIRVLRFDSQLRETYVNAGAWQKHPDWRGVKGKSLPEASKSDLGIVILATDVSAPFAKFSTLKDSNVSDAVYVGIGLREGNVHDQKIRYAQNIDAFRLRFRNDGGTWISRGTAVLCKGDSGGPLLGRDGGVLGIASAVSYENLKTECGNAKRSYHTDVQENIVWIVCSFARSGHPLPGFPVPSAESCR